MSSETISTMVAFGRVVNIRTVPSRQVTQVVIEIPEEFHVQATSMLYNKDAFVLAASPTANVAYGVVPLDAMGQETPTASRAEAHGETAATRPAASTPSAMSVRSGGLSHNVNPTQWLAIQCSSVPFMDWLGVDNTSAAIDRVRVLCHVQSRKEIPSNPAAMQKFMSKIYLPFNKHMEQARSMLAQASRA